MGWYDRFAAVYDRALEALYRPYRLRLAAALEPGRGDLVLDLACGTGQNFPPLVQRLRPSGARIVGVDASAGMLARAAGRIEREGLREVSLLCADARRLDPAALQEAAGGDGRVDAVVCALGLSVMPDWESVFAASFERLRPGGQYLVLDVHAGRRVPQTTLVEWIARADLSRRVWEPLAQVAEGFALERLGGSPHRFGGELFLASGRRPAPRDGGEPVPPGA